MSRFISGKKVQSDRFDEICEINQDVNDYCLDDVAVNTDLTTKFTSSYEKSTTMRCESLKNLTSEKSSILGK